MSYSSPVFTAVTGGTILASQHNTYLRDNLAAIWVYTTVGDIAYATSASALARLAKPANPAALRETVAGTPAWIESQNAGWQILRSNGGNTDLEFAPLLQICVVRCTTSPGMNSTPAAILWDTEIQDDLGWHSTVSNTDRITPGVAGIYKASAFIPLSGANTNLTHVQIYVNGVTRVGAMRSGVQAANGYVVSVEAISYPVSLGATDYFTVLVDNANVTGAPVGTDSWFAVERIR